MPAAGRVRANARRAGRDRPQGDDPDRERRHLVRQGDDRQRKKPALYPSWADLQAWQTQYGLELVSSGATKAKFNQIDAAHQWSESCGTLPVFQAHGFNRAWGLFDYPNDSWTVDAQSSIVANCFAWGRDYANKINTRSGQASPWFGYVKQLVGGSCNDPALPCYNPAVAPGKRYTLPSTRR